MTSLLPVLSEFRDSLMLGVQNYRSQVDCALAEVIGRAYSKNSWFTPENQLRMLESITAMLEENKLKNWLAQYAERPFSSQKKNIGIIMAGNIPAVGFHDLLCVLSSGNQASVKLSSDDSILVKWLGELLVSHYKNWKDSLWWVEKIHKPDAVIVTGSNNTARYFQYYFSSIPHIIRKNRNGVAILTGKESKEELIALGHDILDYFGLGCRNVSKLYVPPGYSFNNLFEVLQSWGGLMQHNRYMNNYDYYRAVFLLNKISFLINNFVILKEDVSIASPVSVLHFSYYENEKALRQWLSDHSELIQCIVSQQPGDIPFGKTQQPGLEDYADGLNTMRFCLDCQVAS